MKGDDRHIMCARREKVAGRYLGDGVYAAPDGYGIWLTAENGIEATDAIYLEPDVLSALVKFADDTRGQRP